MAVFLPNNLLAIGIDALIRNQTASSLPITDRRRPTSSSVPVTGDVGPGTLVLVAADAAENSIEAVSSVLVSALDLPVEVVVIGQNA